MIEKTLKTFEIEERSCTKGTPMAIDSAYKTIQHAASLQDQNLEVAQDGVEQSRFGRPPSRPVGTEKDVKYEERPGMLGDSTPPEGNALISSLGLRTN